MSCQTLRACQLLAMVCLLVVAPSISRADPLPRFEKPILVTGTGQTPGSLTMTTLLDRLGIKTTHDPIVLPSKMGGYKTMIVVMGASLKGLGAAGINQEEELDRDRMIFKKARELGMKIVAAHIEGTARRNAIADKFIIPFAPQADFILVFEEGNKDGLFTTLAAEKKVPLVTFKDFREEFANIVKTIFP
ncbi:MAG: DUF6305 family protein [Acidobacteria bacterium]|nr:DUF6305 family protein [Acidobacteriota bacterium]